MEQGMDYDVVIVGGGVSGLACAKALQENRLTTTVLEAADKVGGRIRTDHVNGFQLDHGFQVLQTGYPDISRYLDLEGLQLHTFPAGVAVRHQERFHIVADPRYHPGNLISTITSPIGTFGDRLKLLKLARCICRNPIEEIFKQPEEQSKDFLRDWGFSEKFIQSFFVPFFAGACLDRNIKASSRVLKYIFRLFAMGDAALPARGMGAIPEQLATGLSSETIRLNARVAEINDGSVTLADGQTIRGQQIVVATGIDALGELLHIDAYRRSVGESCLYFSATDWRPPFQHPFLALNGEDSGPINNIAFPSLAAPEYAPEGKILIGVVVLDDEYRNRDDLEDLVRHQCQDWFGDAVKQWEHLRTYRIDHALPDQSPPTDNPYVLPEPFKEKIRICGEYKSLPGLQWAMMSGYRTGLSIVKKGKFSD